MSTLTASYGDKHGMWGEEVHLILLFFEGLFSESRDGTRLASKTANNARLRGRRLPPCHGPLSEGSGVLLDNHSAQSSTTNLLF